MQFDHDRHELLPAGKRQQLPGELLATSGGSPDCFDGLDVFWLAQLALQDLRIAGDDHEQIVEIMRDASRELAEGFHLLRLSQLLPGLVERDLRLTLGSDIARYLGEPGQFTRIVADGLDQLVGVEATTVLAYEPAFRLVLPLAHRGDEGILRHVLRAIFLGVKFTEVLTDNLIGAVAFDLFGAGIPAAHMPVEIEHADGGTTLIANDLPDAVQMTNESVTANDPLFVTEVAP